MILFGGRESENELSPPYSLSTGPSLLITHSTTAQALLRTGIHRVDVEKIVIAMLGLLLLHPQAQGKALQQKSAQCPNASDPSF